jgi:Mg-chelatase subunit ChlD
MTLDTTQYPDGQHSIKVKAYDPDKNSASDVKAYRFNNWNVNVKFITPVQNSYLKGTITVSVQTDRISDSIKLYVDSMLVNSSNVLKTFPATYSFSLNTVGFSDGSHALNVEAYYSRSKETSTNSTSVIIDNTAPTVTDVTVTYLNGLTAVRGSGDKVAISAKVSDLTSGLNTVTLDATNIGGSSSLTMLDDGSHNDGEAGDGVYGSGPIDASGKMGHMRVFVKATDKATNSYTGSTSVAIDDHTPIITNTYIVYPGAQTAAKTGDDVRVIAKIVDTTVFVDVVMVLDNSNSIKANWGTVKDDAKKFVDSLGANDRTAVYSFDGENGQNSLKPKQEIGFTQDKTTVKNKIDNIVADDGTPLYDTIYAAIQYAKTSNNMPVVVVLTDGNDCGWWGCYSTHPFSDVQYASVPIFTIGLDPGPNFDKINETALKGIADTSNGGAYYYSPSTADLQQIYQTIAGKIKEFEVGGISSAYVDLLNIGAGSSNPIYDDGSHGDGAAKDNVFGSNIITITSAATDQFNYTVHATDVGGNTAQLVGTIKIDNTPPTVTFVKPLFQTLNWWASDGDMVQFSATVSDLGNVGGVATVRLDATSIGGGPNVVMRDDGTNGDVVAGDGIYTSDQVQISTGLSTGLKVVTVYATDIAANAGSGAGGIYVDNHRPMVLELVSPAANQYIEGKYTFQVLSNDVTGIDQVQINIDNKWYTMAYNAQSGYYEFILNTSTMQDGGYKATVQATDIGGKVNNGPTDQIFFIDNTPPTLVLNYPKDGDVVSGLVKINTTGTADRFLAAIEYKADDLAWAPVTTLWNTTKLVDGPHTLTVRAKDSIGHETTRTIKVIVDNGNPEAYFVTPITGQALSGKVTFQIWATDSVQVTGVALTGSIIGLMEHNSVTGYYELIVDTNLLVDGTYTVGGLVMDPGGHILTLAPVTFYVDNGFPVIKVIKPVNNAILKGNVSVQLNVTDGPFSPVSVQWRIDEGAWKNVTVQSFWWNTTTYSDAKHTFYVQATDRAGHLVSTSVAITIDNNPPTIEMASPINGQFIEGTFIFKIHSYDTVGVDKVVLQIEGVNNWTIINNVGTIYFEQAINTTKIKDGSYYVSATSYDLSGYITKGTRIKINIDNNAPQLLVYSPTDGEYISGENYTIGGVATDTFMSSIVYDVDGFGERPINKTLDTTLLADGEHAISVIAKDLAGHMTIKKVRVYIDNSRPTVSAVSPQPLEAVSGRYTFRVSAQDINGIANVTLVYGNVTIPMFLNSVNGYFEAVRDTTRDQDGQKSFVFKATDKSGKVTNLTLTTQLDNNAPTVTVQSPTDSARGTIRFRVQATDPSGVAQVLVRIGGSDWRDMREDNGSYVYSWKTAYSDNGDQAYDIKAVDKLGNSKVYSFGLTVSNPSGKQNYDWLWLLLFIMLVVCLLAVVLTSRTRSSSNNQRDYRAAPRGYDTRMAAEEDYTGAPRPLPGRMAGPGGRQPPTDQVKELGTPAHKVAMRQLQQDVVVSQPSEDEVQFMSTDDDMTQVPMAVGALRSTDAMDQGDEDVQFLDDETGAPDGGDEVSFDEDGSDEVSFSPDSSDEVAFMDESPAPGGDEVSFSDDSGDDVSFSDDSAPASDEDIQFLDDEAPPAQPAPKPKPPERRVPVTLTPRRATATPAVTPRRPPPSVSKGAIAGIDDLLSGGGGTPRPASRTTKPPAPKAKPAPVSDHDPLGDVIGDL